jgi:hypothetical protein
VAADPISALVGFLKVQTPVTALGGTRVFGGELPRNENQSMPRTAIVLSPAGGGLIGLEYQTFGDQRVDVACYGATVKASWDLYLAVHQALKLLKREVYADTLLHWARLSSAGASGRTPDTDWPITISSWQVLAAEVVAA